MKHDEILNELRRMLLNNIKENVVDLDESLHHKFDFEVCRFEDLLRGTSRMIPPNRWSFYRIGLVKKGSGEFITGIHKYKAKKNTLVIIPTRVITSSKNWTLDMEGFLLLFNVDFFLKNNFPHKYIESKKVLTGSMQPYIHLSDEDANEIEAIFKTIIKENESGNTNKDELIALKIIELLIQGERYFDEQLHFETNLPVINIIKKFSDLVETNFLNERSVTFYAEQLNVHPNYLNSLIKKQMGITAKESIQNRLLLEAKYLLHSTDLSIKEISNEVGFNDPNYFTSFFTRLENISPGNYRSSFI